MRAAAVAALLSGGPSTLWACVCGDDPLAATRAAGRLLLPRRDSGLLVAATAAHVALSLGWAAAIAAVQPEGLSARGAVIFGAGAGALIAAVDLGSARRSTHPRLAAVRALPVAPQIADHIAFGACVALVLARAELR